MLNNRNYNRNLSDQYLEHLINYNRYLWSVFLILVVAVMSVVGIRQLIKKLSSKAKISGSKDIMQKKITQTSNGKETTPYKTAGLKILKQVYQKKLPRKTQQQIHDAEYAKIQEQKKELIKKENLSYWSKKGCSYDGSFSLFSYDATQNNTTAPQSFTWKTNFHKK